MAAYRSWHVHHTNWREPKLHIIYEVGKGGTAEGRARADWRTYGASGLPRPGGSCSSETAPYRIWVWVDAIAEAAGIPAGNARTVSTTVVRSGILRRLLSSRGSGTYASVCGGWTA